MMILRRRFGAFTLVELLVVVAIIALLLALLTPMLNRGVEMARRVQCATNLRSVADAMHVFAGNHDGRAPGHAVLSGSNGNSQMGFYGYLYVEGAIGKGVQTIGPYQKGNFGCPSFREDAWTTMGYPRAWLLNQALEGGPQPHPHAWQTTDPNYWQQGGPYGKLIDPPPPGYDLYTLGAVVMRFPHPNWQFMMWESHAGTDYTSWRWGEPENITLYGASGPEAGYPPWGSNPYAQWAFRHVLPADVSLYQAQASANFLFVDTHVEVLYPGDRINRPDRFDFKQ